MKSGRLVAQVTGKQAYRVSIWINGDRLGYVCSCPAGADGDFCKHCVAVAIAWVEQPPPRTTSELGANANDANVRFTAAEGQCLAFVYYFTKVNRRAATISDVRSFFDLAQIAAATLLDSLEQRRLIRREPTGAIHLSVSRAEIPDLE